MWILLSHNFDKEYHLKEMAVILEKEKNPRLPIYEHHIKSMIKSGIVTTTQKLHNKHQTTFYRAFPITIIAIPRYYENLNQNNNNIKNSFMKSFKSS